MIGTDNYDNILSCLQTAKKELGDSLSAIEYMDYESVAFSLNYFKIDNPFRESNFKHYLLIEISSNQNEDQINEQVMDLLERLQDRYEDGIVCENES